MDGDGGKMIVLYMIGTIVILMTLFFIFLYYVDKKDKERLSKEIAKDITGKQL